MMTYLAKFGMKCNPFIKNANQYLFESTDYKQLMFRLKHLEETKGIGLITGAPGLGKTTCIRNWIKSLNKSAFSVYYVHDTTLSFQEFYRELAAQMGIEPAYRKRDNFNNIRSEIERLNIEKRITPVIILDESTYLPNSILNDLKMLFNFDMDSKDKAILLLIGQSSIKVSLSRNAAESLKQRLILTYDFVPFDKLEARRYIDETLKAVGLNTEIITSDAYEQVINYANGIPRIINQVMDKALLLLCNRKEEVINGEMMREAINEADL